MKIIKKRKNNDNSIILEDVISEKRFTIKEIKEEIEMLKDAKKDINKKIKKAKLKLLKVKKELRI